MCGNMLNLHSCINIMCVLWLFGSVTVAPYRRLPLVFDMGGGDDHLSHRLSNSRFFFNTDRMSMYVNKMFKAVAQKNNKPKKQVMSFFVPPAVFLVPCLALPF